MIRGIERELIDVLKVNTSALTINSAAIERLAEQAASQIAASTKMHEVLMTRTPLFERIIRDIEEGEQGRTVAVKAVNDHTDLTVAKWGRWMVAALFVCTTVLAVATLFDGLGTRWLTASGFVEVKK